MRKTAKKCELKTAKTLESTDNSGFYGSPAKNKDSRYGMPSTEAGLNKTLYGDKYTDIINAIPMNY